MDGTSAFFELEDFVVGVAGCVCLVPACGALLGGATEVAFDVVKIKIVEASVFVVNTAGVAFVLADVGVPCMASIATVEGVVFVVLVIGLRRRSSVVEVECNDMMSAAEVVRAVLR